MPPILNIDLNEDDLMRSPDQKSINYYKAFKEAKTEEERIHIAKQAASDTSFEPCRPSSMHYAPSKKKPTVLLDVDQCLLKGVGLKTQVNTRQIDGLINQGLTEGYLFSSMSVDAMDRSDENEMSRVDLIAYMALKGFKVNGVFTQADAADNATPGDFYSGYYNTVLGLKNRGNADPSIQMKKDFAQSEQARYNLFGGEESIKSHLFGAKTQMFKSFLEQNSQITDVWMVDDALPNLLGALKILKDMQKNGLHKDTALHLCPVDKNKWEENYDAMFKQHLRSHHAAGVSNAELLLVMMQSSLKTIMSNVKKDDEFKQFATIIEGALSNPSKLNIKDLCDKFIALTTKVSEKNYELFATDFNRMEEMAECINLLPGIKTPMNATQIVIGAGRGDLIERLENQRKDRIAKKVEDRQKHEEGDKTQATPSSSHSQMFDHSKAPAPKEPVRPEPRNHK